MKTAQRLAEYKQKRTVIEAVKRDAATSRTSSPERTRSVPVPVTPRGVSYQLNLISF